MFEENLHKEITFLTRICVQGLSFLTEEQQLKDVFSKYGDITNIKIIRDNLTGESKCYGFVTFDKQSDCEKLLESTKVINIDNMEWTLLQAKKQRRKPPHSSSRYNVQYTSDGMLYNSQLCQPYSALAPQSRANSFETPLTTGAVYYDCAPAPAPEEPVYQRPRAATFSSATSSLESTFEKFQCLEELSGAMSEVSLDESCENQPTKPTVVQRQQVPYVVNQPLFLQQYDAPTIYQPVYVNSPSQSFYPLPVPQTIPTDLKDAEDKTSQEQQHQQQAVLISEKQQYPEGSHQEYAVPTVLQPSQQVYYAPSQPVVYYTNMPATAIVYSQQPLPENYYAG